MKTICFIAGTRPEIIKIAPVIRNFKASAPDRFNTVFCSTGQHKTMADQAACIFDLEPDFNLNIMSENQSLNQISAKIFELLPRLFDTIKPDLVFLQGDTSSAAISGLVAFNMRIPVAHIEAGLRTFKLDAPFPEELNRRLIANYCKFNFAPTLNARNNLLKENCHPDTIFVTGNTVVDALEFIKAKYDLDEIFIKKFAFDVPFVLLTAHRRESFGQGFENIFKAISAVAKKHERLSFVYPMHLNPNVRQSIIKYLSSQKNILLLEPVPYLELLSLLKHCEFCVTDSGGIQEEAPSFNKYTIVLRDYTERTESLEMGLSELVGTSRIKIMSSIESRLNSQARSGLKAATNPFGDGDASRKIFAAINNYFNHD